MNPQHGHPHPHEPLDPQERALARLLDDAIPGEPSPELDARILAAARAASQPAATDRPRLPARRRPRWPLALGLAASVTLAVGVAWQLREPPRPAPASVPVVDEDAPPAARASRAGDAAVTGVAPPTEAPRPAGTTAGETTTADTRSDAPPIDAAAEHQAAVAAAAERTAQRQQKAARQSEAQALAEAEQEREREAATAAAMQRSTQRGEKAARQAAATPPPAPPPPAALEIAEPRLETYQAPAAMPAAPALAPAPAPMADTGIQIQAAPAASAAPREYAPATTDTQAKAVSVAPVPVLSAADAATLEADARLPAARWLQRIREHRDHGDAALAHASAVRFVLAHPDHALPDDLQPLLP